MAGKTTQKQIIITVELDENKLPERILWEAEDSGMSTARDSKSMMLSFWDRDEDNTMRFDLHTKDMYVDEMKNHFLQTLVSMAETYRRATGHNFVLDEMKTFTTNLSRRIEEAENEKEGRV